MGRNCLDCAHARPLDDRPNENGGQFIACAAPVPVPAFGMHYALSQVQRAVNVAIFGEAHPCHEWAIAQDCGFHEAAAAKVSRERIPTCATA